MYRNFMLIALTAGLLGVNVLPWEDKWLDKLVAKFEKYQQTYPSEKAYLHLDRPYYSVGETIWFKAYLVYGISHAADSISRVLYVDLVNKATAKVILLKKVELNGGVGHGELALADSLAEGEYQVRAYTQWMRNFSEDFFFRKDVKVLKPKNAVAVFPPNADEIDVQFMPEGGELVEGLEGRVAFKAVNALGKGIEVKGAVINQANDTLAGFSTSHLGMGFFSFMPEAGQEYRIEVKKLNGQFVKYSIPKVKKEGFTVTVDNLSNKDNVRVIVRHNKPLNASAEMSIFAHTRGSVGYAAKATLAKKTVLFSIPKANLGEGVTHITLFDDAGLPTAERLVYIQRNRDIEVSIAPSKPSYKPREKIELEITAKDTEGNPVMGHFSLAATDVKQVLDKEPNVQNIRSYFLLSSDLQGAIEQPSGYFNKSNPNAASQMDVLLMTQGWRRFNWNEVLKDSLALAPFFVEQGISFSGKVARMNKKMPGKVKLTYMIVQKDSTRSVMMGETAETGEFLVYDLDVRDTTEVLVQAVTERGNRNINILLNPFQPAKVTLAKIPLHSIQFDPNELNEYLKRTEEYLRIERQIRASREQLLNEVVVKAKRPDPIKDDSRRAMYGEPSNSVKFDVINTAGALSIFDVIQGRVPGVQITGSGMNRSIQIRGAANFSGVVEPLFLLDGMAVSKDAIMSIPPTDVEAVDILKGANAAIYGSQGGGGVVAILTKRGGSTYDWAKDQAEGVITKKILGYSPIRVFYAPKYDKEAPEHVQPDFRATLFWEPMIQTDKEGKAKVSFFASDAQTEVKVRLEGMNATGALGVKESTFKVN